MTIKPTPEREFAALYHLLAEVALVMDEDGRPLTEKLGQRGRLIETLNLFSEKAPLKGEERAPWRKALAKALKTDENVRRTAYALLAALNAGHKGLADQLLLALYELTAPYLPQG